MGTGNLKSFRGKAANVIGYQSYGKDPLRSMPNRVRQTVATKQSGLHAITAPRGTVSVECHLAAVNCVPDDPEKFASLDFVHTPNLKHSG